MSLSFDALGVLPATDWLAVAGLFAAWVGYARFAKKRASVQPSILDATNRIRRQWMLQTTRRENRVIDGVVVQNLSTSPSFFASTTILIIGGLLAVLGTNDKATEFVREIPFAARTTVLVFDLKVAMLTAIFVYAFFRFTWSMRQYTFGALLVASAPEHDHPWTEAEREAFATRAGRVMGLAAETFNDGLRAYYMAFAAIGWFFSPWASLAATAFVVGVLYRREFRSDVLVALRGD
ncbi:MAG: DUF599 domain-containing protein [Burkholderiaceae bacterium]